MPALTASLALILGLLIVLRGPVVGLSIYCLGLFAYPQFVTLQIGTVDFTLSRILVLLALAQLVFRHRLHREFRWNHVDSVYLSFWLLSTVALFANESPMSIVVRRGGAFVDTVLPYFAVRIAVRTTADLIRFVKRLLYIGVVLALLGIYQSVTWNNPMGFLKSYANINDVGPYVVTESLVRHGFYRADVSFGQYIGFGMFFAALCPLCLAMSRRKGGWPPAGVVVCFLFLFAGMMSSWSSGPLFSVVVALGFVAGFRWRRLWKVFVLALILVCVVVELYSNRHFPHVFTRFAFSNSTAYYRIELYEEALGGGMDEHWLCGWGLIGIESPLEKWNWRHRDLTSLYIETLARFGLLGLVPLIALTYAYYRRLFQAARLARRTRDMWLVWCFSGGLVGWTVGTFTVGFVGQMAQLSSILIGAAVNMPALVSQPGRTKSTPVAIAGVRPGENAYEGASQRG